MNHMSTNLFWDDNDDEDIKVLTQKDCLNAQASHKYIFDSILIGIVLFP